jgi:uncharacterized cupredoxin-like copper-binding protein
MRGGTMRSGVATAAVLALGLLSASCGGGGGNVDVTLQEFAVLPAEDSVSAGEVTFNVTNDGPDDEHEFVLFRTDLDAGALPTAEDGSVDEEGEGVTLIDEIEGMAVGANESLTVDLEAGAYVMLCNIVETAEDGTVEVHYQLGMRTAFTVE